MACIPRGGEGRVSRHAGEGKGEGNLVVPAGPRQVVGDRVGHAVVEDRRAGLRVNRHNDARQNGSVLAGQVGTASV